MASSTMINAATTQFPALGNCPSCIRQELKTPFSGQNVCLGRSAAHQQSHNTSSINVHMSSQRQGAMKTRAMAGENVSRRRALQTAVLTGIASLVPTFAEAPQSTAASDDLRQQLLDAIAAKNGVQEAIDRIAEINPTKRPNKSDKVDGKWKLLWSSDVAEVSKVTRFLPIGAESFQLIGPGGGVGEGRAMNIVSVGGGAVQLKLTSSCVPDEKNDNDFVVGPPFKLELFLGSKGFPISEVKDTSSPRTPILGNELNTFEQVYLEDSGKPGDLRVSRVLVGDERVVGSIFVHERV